jgi:hypothetical protein
VKNHAYWGYDYYMRGTKLGTTQEKRDIGVTITRNLKPSAHCNTAAGRAMAVLSQIKWNFHYRDRHIFVKLYKQYARPHLESRHQPGHRGTSLVTVVTGR